MKRLSLGFKIGIVFALLHLGLAIYAFTVCINSCSSTAGLVYIIFFFLDAPFLFLPRAIFEVFGEIRPLIEYGIFGSALWFFIPYLLDKILVFVLPKANKIIRAVIIFAAAFLVFWGFKHLSNFGISSLIKQERPAELKKSLEESSSDFLTEKIVFESNSSSNIYNINDRLIATSRTEIVWMNDEYEKQQIVNLGKRRCSLIQPFIDVNNILKFLAYIHGKGIYVFDSGGKELWNFIDPDVNGIGIDGARYGDVDGDGRQEIAVLYRYTKGITLLDCNGSTMWTHPANAMGAVEIIDINNDGKAEIIYDNSNNARGKTTFEILDSSGTTIRRMVVETKSYEFKMLKWPCEKSELNIILTETNKIRIIDLNGNMVLVLDAPGCREYGHFNAAAVKFDNKQPTYLVVNKKLHPDILVLYVYDDNGKLVYQKNDILRYSSNATIAVKPANDGESEKLLRTSSTDKKEVIFEYSLR